MDINFDESQFIPIENRGTGKTNSAIGPEISLAGSYLSLSREMSRFYAQESGKKFDEFGTNKISLNIEVMQEPPVIKLTPTKNPFGGFKFVNNEREGRVRTPIPTLLKQLKLPKGIYRQIPEHPYIFTYKEPLSERPKIVRTGDPDKVEIGDTVSWQVKLPSGAQMAVQGRVLRQRNPDVATMIVETPEYQQYFPGKHQSELKVNKLTIVKKGV